MDEVGLIFQDLSFPTEHKIFGRCNNLESGPPHLPLVTVNVSAQFSETPFEDYRCNIKPGKPAFHVMMTKFCEFCRKAYGGKVEILENQLLPAS